MSKKISPKYKSTITYHGMVDIPQLGGYIFNHGTESEFNTRTKQHCTDCTANGLTYEILEEKQDRIFGSTVINAAYDSTFIDQLVDRLNDTILSKHPQKAAPLKSWAETLSAGKLSPIQLGYYQAVDTAKLSKTECCFIPDIVTRGQLAKAIEYVEKHWYYTTKSLRISAKAYKDKTADEQKVAAKPIPKAFIKKVINSIKHKKKFVELLNYRKARVQGIECAYTVSCLSELRNLKKIRVVVVADDLATHKETYNAIKDNSKFEFVYCDSDIDVIEEYKNMDITPDLDIVNPPYEGSLHLQIADVLVANKAPCSTIISIQPVRWLEDPLSMYKQGADAQKYSALASAISSVQIIDATTACKSFNIMHPTDLAIFVFDKNSGKNKIAVNPTLILTNKLLDKISTMRTLNDLYEKTAIDGYRCEVKKITSGTGGHNLGNAASSKIADVLVVWGPYSDGYDKAGKFFTETRQKNQFTKDTFAQSICFDTLSEADNFNQSCNTKFYRRLIHLFKWDQNVPLRFLPYMEDYTKAWTDEDYCKFFDLTPDEAEFMCKDIEDYRVKDFITYTNLNED